MMGLLSSSGKGEVIVRELGGASRRRNHCASKPAMTFATKSAKSGCEQSQQGNPLFDHLVGENP